MQTDGNCLMLGRQNWDRVFRGFRYVTLCDPSCNISFLLLFARLEPWHIIRSWVCQWQTRLGMSTRGNHHAHGHTELKGMVDCCRPQETSRVVDKLASAFLQSTTELLWTKLLNLVSPTADSYRYSMSGCICGDGNAALHFMAACERRRRSHHSLLTPAASEVCLPPYGSMYGSMYDHGPLSLGHGLGTILPARSRHSLSSSSPPSVPFSHTFATSYVPRYRPLPSAVHPARSSPPRKSPRTPRSW